LAKDLLKTTRDLIKRPVQQTLNESLSTRKKEKVIIAILKALLSGRKYLLLTNIQNRRIRMNLTAIIIVAICVAGITSIISTLNDKKGKEANKFNKQERDDMLQQIQQMNERIETLERIVTDEKYSLNKEFQNLR
jgi:siroheme synthase (precorrin-2 oxidase/ferrochelatase)